jgi:hypothetical protein
MAFEPAQQHQAAAPLQGPLFEGLLAEFAASAMSAGINAFGAPNRALIFAAAARACGPFDSGPGRSHPVSVNALAASLARPFETIRRQANMLIEAGLLVRSETGLSVPLQVICDPRVALMADGCHDLLVRLVEDVRAANLLLPEPRPGTTYDPRAGIGIAFDLLLATIECHHQRNENWTRLSLIFAIKWANRRFAHAAGPYLAPVKPSTVARILGLPYATVSRNLEGLVASGRLRRVPEGLVIAPDLVAAPVAIARASSLAGSARSAFRSISRRAPISAQGRRYPRSAETASGRTEELRPFPGRFPCICFTEMQHAQSTGIAGEILEVAR